MFGCLVAGRLVSAARAAGAALDSPGGPSTRRGPGVELPQGRPAGLAFALSWAPLGVGPGQRGELAVLVTAARRLGWLLPLVPRGGCVVEAGCREAVAVPSVNGEVWAVRRRAASLKEAF